MQIQYIVFFLVLLAIPNVSAQSCPLRCPSCMKCDTKRGTCTLPRDFVACMSKTTPSLPGVCFAGRCNTQVSLPNPVPRIGRCQTMKCPPTGQCALVNQPDGFDCTPDGAAAHSVCVSGVCTPVLLGLSDTFPLQNIGCIGVTNGALCDTNDLMLDGERCMNGICQYPDGYYYGYLPAPAV